VTTPTFYIFSGLPGSGKSTLAKGLAKAIGAVYLRIDTIEQALRDLCNFKVEGEGYRLSYRIAKDNLLTGNNVVADSCNPIELTRVEFEEIANSSGADHRNIEVICSDPQQHQRQVEERVSEVLGLELPDWEAVQAREFHPWKKDHITIDTAHQSIKESLDELIKKLELQS